jgi:type VI secretion system protein
MGHERALLHRLAEIEDSGRGRYEPSATEDLDLLMESVRAHLARLLNARHGMSEAMPDYGIPAMTDLTVGSGDYVHRVQDSIRVAIEKYEPRLGRIRVTRADEDEDESRQQLIFRVDAVLHSQSGDHRVCYETQVAGNGRFDVLD